MATNEAVTPPVGGEDETRPVEMPEGWLERALEQASRLGRQDVPKPARPEPEPPTDDGEGEIKPRYVDGLRVGLRGHPSWPPGHIEWLHEMQRTGELDLGDPDELRLDFKWPNPE